MIKKIAVIGAGPAGLAAAKALAAEPGAFSIDVFDKRPTIGGVWCYGGDKTGLALPVPSTDPNVSDVVTSPPRLVVGPMYKHMETNLTDTLMEFAGVPFKPKTKDFVPRDSVLKYLEEYAKTIPKPVNFRLATDVVKVTAAEKWTLVSRACEVTQSRGAPVSAESTASEDQVDVYDAVVVANGHSELPYIPATPGLKEWAESDPSSVTHSKYFDDCAPYQGKRVLVIGNYASGQDLATQIGTVASHVYVSTKDEVRASNYSHLTVVGVVNSYNHATRSVKTDIETISHIDVIVFCTGYLYSLPFLTEGATDGSFVKDVYRQIFDVHHPTLAHIGLPKFVSPLPLVEAQAAVVARVFSGRIKLPSQDDMKAEYERELATKGPGKLFHSFEGCDYEYCNSLYKWITELATGDAGLMPLFWDKSRIFERQDVSERKKARAAKVARHAAELRAQGKPFDFPPQENADALAADQWTS